MNNIQEGINSEVNGLKNDLGERLTEIKNVATKAGQQVFDSAKDVYREIKAEGKDLAGQMSNQAGKSVDKTREYIINNPFRSIGIAVGLGLLFGYLSRRS